MTVITKELHDAVYKNILWPHDLLDNLKDPDYLKVEFDSYLQGTRAEVVFMDEGRKIHSYYFFNSLNYLQRVEMIEEGSVYILYSRIDDVVKLLTEMNELEHLDEILELIAA